MTTLNTLVQRTRRFMGDWPSYDAITASVTSSATSLAVADNTKYKKDWLVELDAEIMRVGTVPTTTTSLTVSRAQMGTTGASHASAASVLINPAFNTIEYMDALNDAYQASWPYMYRNLRYITVTTDSDTYEYTVPSVSSSITYLPLVYLLEAKYDDDVPYGEVRGWSIKRGDTPLIVLRSSLPAGSTLRISGYAPFEELTALTDSLHALFPTQAVGFLPQYAAQLLLASGEARRVRVDTLPTDSREQANRVGSSMSAASALLQRYQMRLQACAMPPMSKHIRSVV